jgi:hypothetical protein
MTWEVGDLALCVDGGPCRSHPYPGAPLLAQAGAVYTVYDAWVDDDGDLLLALAELPEWGFGAERFRKILPDAHEACEEEFVTLLKRTKRKVSA